MKSFIAFRFTGEDPNQLEPLMVEIRDSLKDCGVDAYCTLFDEAEFQKKSHRPAQIMEHAFGIIDDIDFLFVIQTSDNKSEGMLMEVGYCIAKGTPVVVATKDTVGCTYIPDVATTSFKWNTIDDLKKHIRGIDYHGLTSTD